MSVRGGPVGEKNVYISFSIKCSNFQRIGRGTNARRGEEEGGAKKAGTTARNSRWATFFCTDNTHKKGNNRTLQKKKKGRMMPI